MKLKDKVAVITGAAVGIGRTIAIEMAREGACVVVNYSKSSNEAEETVSIIQNNGNIASSFRADISCHEDCDQLIDYTLKQYGEIDILVNNAGITRFIPFSEMNLLTDEVWDELYDTNVKGAFYCSRAAAKYMKPGSSIITLGSQAGLRPFGSCIAYSVSKAALIHLTKCLALTLAPDIRVNCISPGVVKDTRWNDQKYDFDPVKNEKENAEAIPLKIVASPKDIADAVIYLSGSDAGFITGAILPIDGGKTLCT